jgi:hypothetical protein
MRRNGAESEVFDVNPPCIFPPSAPGPQSYAIVINLNVAHAYSAPNKHRAEKKEYQRIYFALHYVTGGIKEKSMNSQPDTKWYGNDQK